MPFDRRRPRRVPRSRDPVWVVSSGADVEQVFADPADAERFASEIPGARISRHQVRRSADEAVAIYDRRVVVAGGTTVLDSTSVVHRFIDDPRDAPPADVEWFHDTRDAEWHIAGFGIDEAALDEKVRHAIARIRAVDHASPMEHAR